jgi:hypothetical protein
LNPIFASSKEIKPKPWKVMPMLYRSHAPTITSHKSQLQNNQPDTHTLTEKWTSHITNTYNNFHNILESYMLIAILKKNTNASKNNLFTQIMKCKWKI